jgi:hypothetical protein
VNVGSVVLVPSGEVTFTVRSIHLSPYCALAVGGGRLIQKLTLTVCPTPTGLGDTLQKEYVGILKADVWALTFGISIIEADIESIKNVAIRMLTVLFLLFFIFFSSFFLWNP